MELQLRSVALQLHDSLAYPWHMGDGCCVRGYAFAGDALLQGDELLAHIHGCTCLAQLEAQLRGFNGFFNVIAQLDDAVVACVDPVSSMPLFYTDDPAPMICDGVGPTLLKDHPIQQEQLELFRHGLYVPGDRTLLKEVYQVRAGSYAVYQEGRFRQVPYFRTDYAPEQITELQQAIPLLDEAYTATFRRTVEALNGRTAVLPLSGGHDSRLIAAYLKRLGYEKVIAYTYGLSENAESSASRQVAAALQIPWHFVEYDPAGMRKLMKKHFPAFASLAGNATAVPCLQEWYAVYRLKEMGILDENCVIIPGYTGDFLSGGHLIQGIDKMHPITSGKLRSAIQARHFRERPFCKLTAQAPLDARLMQELPVLAEEDRIFTEDEANLINEQFDWQNRQGLFIMNALRVYDFFGIQWMTPLFEHSQFDIWSRIHNSLRYGRKAFFALEETVYPEALKAVPFASDVAALPSGTLARKLTLLLRGPRALHPLYGYFPTGLRARLDLVKHRLRGVNMYTQDLYLKLLDTCRSEKEG